MEKKEKVIIECFDYLKQLEIELNVDSFKQCIQVYYDLMLDSKDQKKIVLDAKPGHGKTTALYCFVNYLITKTDYSLLLVFKEIEQQKKLKNFLLQFHSEEIINRKLLNVNQEEQNLNSVNEFKQLITITHARLENLILDKQFGLKKSDKFIKKLIEINFLEKRKIIIDEEPNLFYFEEFKVDDKSWIDEDTIKTAYDYSNNLSYKVRIRYKDDYTSNITLFQTFIRCMIQMIIVQEQLANNGTETNALINHQTEKDRGAFNIFFEKVENKIENGAIYDNDFIRRFMCFKDLYFNDDAGFFTPEQDKNPKTIVVANKLNFDLLNTDILIMDGTASYFNKKYTELGFKLYCVEDYINYSRAEVIIRNINTSASTRVRNNITFAKQILHDISEAKNEFELEDIPLIPTKSDAEIFEIKIEGNQMYTDMAYVSKHLFNTRGSNELNILTSLYLTALPIKPPNYYRSFARVIYGKGLNYRLRDTRNEETTANSGWFLDERIQEIYAMDILNELIQIIMRTDLRNLNSDTKIKIFIATIRKNLVQKVFEKTKFTLIDSPGNPIPISMQMKITNKCLEIKKYFVENTIEAILPIGHIGDGSSIQRFINNQYDNNKEYFDKKLKENDLELVIIEHGTQKRKYIKILN